MKGPTFERTVSAVEDKITDVLYDVVVEGW